MDAPSFLFIGDSGCGKTTLLAGMYDILNRGYTGYHIEATAETSKMFNDIITNMRNKERGYARFPSASINCIEYNFALDYNKSHVYNFACIDFPGEKLCEPQVNDNDCLLLNAQIQKSPCCFICVSAELFLKNGSSDTHIKEDNSVIIERIRNETLKIRRYVASYIHNSPRDIRAAIIVTKYDLIQDIIIPHELNSIIKKAFAEIFFPSSSSSKRRIVAIFKTSAGKKISNNNYSGEYGPMWLHLPVLYGILWTLTNETINKTQAIKAKDQNALVLNDNMKKISNDVKVLHSKKINWFNRKSIEKKLRNQHEKQIKVQNDIKENTNEIRNLSNAIKKHEYDVKQIFRDLSHSEQSVFYNGNEISWEKLMSEYWE